MKSKFMMIALVGLVLLVVWFRFIGPLAGDGEVRADAEKALEEAKAALTSARSQNDILMASTSVQGTAQLVAVAEQLPQVYLAVDHPILQWYERNLMTPAELYAYTGETSETLEIGVPSYWSNNQTCYPDGVGGQVIFSACEDLGEPTILLGRTQIRVLLEGWQGTFGDSSADCRAALGWIFSRMFLPDGATGGPQGRYLRPWIVPGTFIASPQRCLHDSDLVVLQRHIGIDTEEWPVPEDQISKYFEDQREAALINDDTSGQTVESIVQFDLLFVPISPEVCVRELVGSPLPEGIDDGSISESELLEPYDGCWGRYRANELLQDLQDKSYESRLCLPRISLATVVEDGDLLVSELNASPAATGEWPNDLPNCHIPLPLPQQSPEDLTEIILEDEDTIIDESTADPISEPIITSSELVLRCWISPVATRPAPHEPNYPVGHSHPHDPDERIFPPSVTPDNIAPQTLLAAHPRCE